ncbi:hypothetical protein D3C81_1542860 [compost metagenome]
MEALPLRVCKARCNSSLACNGTCSAACSRKRSRLPRWVSASLRKISSNNGSSADTSCVSSSDTGSAPLAKAWARAAN